MLRPRKPQLHCSSQVPAFEVPHVQFCARTQLSQPALHCRHRASICPALPLERLSCCSQQFSSAASCYSPTANFSAMEPCAPLARAPRAHSGRCRQDFCRVLLGGSTLRLHRRLRRQRFLHLEHRALGGQTAILSPRGSSAGHVFRISVLHAGAGVRPQHVGRVSPFSATQVLASTDRSV